MDFLNKAKEQMSSMSNNNNSGSTGTTDGTGVGQNTTGTATQGNAGTEDYGDKGLDFLEKKTGHTMGREQNEKITDGARGAYEKFSGKKVDSKYSN